MNLKVSLVGYGNLAKALHKTFRAQGLQFHQILSRSQTLDFQDAERVTSISELDKVDQYWIAVKDDEIENVSQSLSGDSLHLHFSGASPLNILKSKDKACIWPMQSFDGEIPIWEEIKTFGSFNNVEIKEKLDLVFKRFKAEILWLGEEEKTKIHLGATLGNNFVNHLLVEVESLSQESGVDFMVFRNLIQKTIDSAFENGPLNSQTGPAKRGDKLSQYRHLDLIKDPGLKSLYKLLSQRISKTHE